MENNNYIVVEEVMQFLNKCRDIESYNIVGKCINIRTSNDDIAFLEFRIFAVLEDIEEGLGEEIEIKINEETRV